MGFSLRAILLLLAVILFVVGALDDTGGDWVFWGLAVFAASFLVEATGMDRRFGASGGPRT